MEPCPSEIPLATSMVAEHMAILHIESIVTIFSQFFDLIPFVRIPLVSIRIFNRILRELVLCTKYLLLLSNKIQYSSLGVFKKLYSQTRKHLHRLHTRLPFILNPLISYFLSLETQFLLLRSPMINRTHMKII